MLGRLGFWTYVLNGSSLVIDASFSFKNLSMELVSGTGSFQGDLISSGIPAAPIALIVQKPVTVTTASTNIIQYLLIDATGGVINIMAF
jgi:hypothetical protein